jgi:hypothetical protein
LALAGVTRMEEQGSREARNEEAWALYTEAERRELQMRREGHLARMLGRALPDESPEELKKMAEEDRLRAEEGLMDLLDESGQITYKHVDELAPQDRTARIRAEGVRVEWLAERWARKRHLQPIPDPIHPQKR